MFLSLPFIYSATVRTHKGKPRRQRFFRGEDLFEIPEISRGELVDSIRVRTDPLPARFSPRPAVDVVRSWDGRLYRPEICEDGLVAAVDLVSALSADPPWSSLLVGHAGPRLPIAARRFLPIAGRNRTPSTDEAARQEQWQFPGVLESDVNLRREEAYRFYLDNYLSVEGSLYVRAREPVWRVEGLWWRAPGKARYVGEPIDYMTEDSFALDEREAISHYSSQRRDSASGTVEYDAVVELFDLTRPRTAPISALAEMALRTLPQLRAGARRLFTTDAEVAGHIAFLLGHFDTAGPPPDDVAEQVLAHTFALHRSVGDRIRVAGLRNGVAGKLETLASRAEFVLGGKPELVPQPALAPEDMAALHGL